MKTLGLRFVLVFILSLAFSVSVFAGVYPEKPIKLIVPFKAGGGTDTQARILQKALKKIVPQPVVVINMPGGGSAIANKKVAESPPDGYTMLFNLAAMFTSHAMGVSQAGLDDFEPVAQTGSAYLLVLVAKNSPYKNFNDLIEAAKEKPDTIKNSTNIGAILHVVSLALGDATGVDFRDVQGGGATKRFASVLGGHSDFTMGLTAESKAYLDSGDFKALAILSKKRHEKFPDVPTVKEQGYDFIGMDVSRWWFMPKGTAKDRVNYMADAIGKAMKDPEVVNFYESRGASPTFLKGKALQEKLYQDRDFIEKLVKKYNLKKK